MRRALVVVMLAGCDDVFDIEKLPVPPACFQESFDGSLADLSLHWDPYSAPGFDATLSGGRLEISLLANTDGYAGVTSNDVYDFTGAAASVSVPVVVSQAAMVQNFMTVGGPGDERYVMNFTDGELAMGVQTGGLTTLGRSIPFDPSAQRYWRIEHDLTAVPAVIVFSTSSDRRTWITRHSVPIAVPIDAVVFNLGAGAYGGGAPTPGFAAYDDFERCPP